LLCSDECRIGLQSEACWTPQPQLAKRFIARKKGTLSPTGASVALTLASGRRRKKPPPAHPVLKAGSFVTLSCALPLPLSPPGLFHRDFSEGNPLDGGPDDGQATRLRREHVDLVGPLTDEAPETLDGVGRLNVAVHALRERVKRQEVLFVLSQASYRYHNECCVKVCSKQGEKKVRRGQLVYIH
jgi:hypothetical protein